MKRTILSYVLGFVVVSTVTVQAAHWPMWGGTSTSRNGKETQTSPPILYVPGSDAPLRETTNQVFWYGHYAFNQALSPNFYVNLAPGNYSYAETTETPLSVTSGIPEFPSRGSGFDASMSAGEMFAGGMGTGGARAVTLRGGNVENPARSGFTLSWSNGITLTNQAGVPELVIYESGGFGGPEAYMVQVHIEGTAVWSDWIFQTESNYTSYRGRSTAGAFATIFDLDSFGVREGERIDQIRIASMNPSDRMRDASGTGVVIPGDNGKTSSHLPDPGRTAVFRAFDPSSFDPDILYVGVLHMPTPVTGIASTSGGGR